ncbi:MAG: SurA N-terminal domain-containing protein [Desulfobacter sp.]|nr:MAG: SurA N-terminal domain-containing protein [Desulfobacter sp.]
MKEGRISRHIRPSCRRVGKCGLKGPRRAMNPCVRKAVNTFTALVAVALFITFMGCGEAPVSDPEYIIRAGTEMVTPQDFAREVELKLAAYPYEIKTRDNEYNLMVMDLVSTLSDETVLLATAGSKGIQVSEVELEKAENDIRQDYPEDSFDRMLMDNAIEYTVWKKRLKKDMVIKKLIDQELVAVQEITPEDMLSFYSQMAESTKGENTETVDEEGLVKQLRMEKSQAAFDQWIQDLKTANPPQINKKALAAFLIN